MTDEQQFFSWAGRAVAGMLLAVFTWLFARVWTRVHGDIPGELKAMDKRLSDDYATKDELLKIELDFKAAIAEQARQRKEMHEEAGKKLDTISQDIRDLRQIILEGERRSHARIDEHISRHHAK